MSDAYLGRVVRGVEVIGIEKGKNYQYDTLICKCIKCGKSMRLHRYCLRDSKRGNVCECSSPVMKHGMSKTRIYSIYAAIKERTVLNTGNKFFIRDYINRGITLCEEWQGKYGFKNFYDWSMVNGYADNLSIDRIDNDGGYSPDNCRWTDAHIQNCNRRNTIKATINGVTKAVADWCIEMNLSYDLVYGRMRRGKTPEEALLLPFNEHLSHKHDDIPSNRMVNQYAKNGEFLKTWDSVYVASEQTGIRRVNILNCCNGRYESAAGYVWKYADCEGESNDKSRNKR